jgi:hypothetical protein
VSTLTVLNRLPLEKFTLDPRLALLQDDPFEGGEGAMQISVAVLDNSERDGCGI